MYVPPLSVLNVLSVRRRTPGSGEPRSSLKRRERKYGSEDAASSSWLLCPLRREETEVESEEGDRERVARCLLPLRLTFALAFGEDGRPAGDDARERVGCGVCTRKRKRLCSTSSSKVSVCCVILYMLQFRRSATSALLKARSTKYLTCRVKVSV